MKVLFIHADTKFAREITQRLQSHLSQLRRIDDYHYTDFQSQADGQTLDYLRGKRICEAQIIFVLYDVDLIADDEIMRFIPYLIENRKCGSVVLPYLIGPVASPELFEAMKFANGLMEKFAIIANDDKIMAEVAKAVKNIQKMGKLVF